MLIGSDILYPEDVELHMGKELAVINSCNGVKTDIRVHHREAVLDTPRRVKTTKPVTVPAMSVVTVPVKYRGDALYSDTEYIFKPDTKLNFGADSGVYTHLMDLNFSYVLVENRNDRPIQIGNKARLGRITEYAYDGCYYVDRDHAHKAATPRTKPTKEGWTRKLFGLANLAANEYPEIWKDSGQTVDVPPEQYMTVPIKQGKEPKPNRVYPASKRDCEVFDKTFGRIASTGQVGMD